MKIIKQINSKFTKILAINNNNILGSIQYFSKNNIGYLTNIYVHEKERDKSIGSILIQKCEIDLKENNIKTIQLVSWESIFSSKSLSNFYLKNGYNFNNNIPNTTYDNGYDIYDIIPFYKNIN